MKRWCGEEVKAVTVSAMVVAWGPGRVRTAQAPGMVLNRRSLIVTRKVAAGMKCVANAPARACRVGPCPCPRRMPTV